MRPLPSRVFFLHLREDFCLCVEKILEPKKELIVSALKPVVENETSLECKKALAQVPLLDVESRLPRL